SARLRSPPHIVQSHTPARMENELVASRDRARARVHTHNGERSCPSESAHPNRAVRPVRPAPQWSTHRCWLYYGHVPWPATAADHPTPARAQPCSTGTTAPSRRPVSPTPHLSSARFVY